jgi:hypothetical protein
VFSLPAYADGGAPNLAYVAGAGLGISIIDIGQKKVTGTFTLGGSCNLTDKIYRQLCEDMRQ